MRLLILVTLLISFNTNATVTVPFSELGLKDRFEQSNIDLNDKNFWHAREIFKRLEDFGMELSDKGRCRYLTRRKLLKHGSQADWDCFFAFRNIVREINYCAPEQWDSDINSETKVRGLLRYVGVAPLPYKYDLVPENGKLTAKTSIYYKGFDDLSEQDQQIVRNKIEMAVDLWNQKTPSDFPYEIDVQIKNNREDAHFTINIVHGWTRGPYLREHSVDWDYHIYAHEIGHMLGLDDEYDQVIGTLFGNSRCTNNSMMCSSHRDGFPRYYWYLIFRRGQCV